MIDSIPLKGRNYRVVTSDYLANGGDNMSFFLNPVKIEKLGIKLRDAMLEYAQVQWYFSSQIDNRIVYDN